MHGYPKKPAWQPKREHVPLYRAIVSMKPREAVYALNGKCKAEGVVFGVPSASSTELELPVMFNHGAWGAQDHDPKALTTTMAVVAFNRQSTELHVKWDTTSPWRWSAVEDLQRHQFLTETVDAVLRSTVHTYHTENA